MRFNKPITLVSVLILLLISINVHLAQDPTEPETPGTSTPQARVHEPARENKIRNSLAGLLAGEGVIVPGTLPTSSTGAYKEIQVRWESTVTPVKGDAVLSKERSKTGAFIRLRSGKRNGSLSRQRSLELSPNQILIVALDQNSELRWWKLMLDPRLVRAEGSRLGGEISGEDLYVHNVDFMVNYPDDPGIKELRFYHPQWTGKAFQLELISTLQVD
jgi:hypothetical protein